MARLQIKFPDHVQFTTELAVRITDLNYGNHVGNDTMLSLMQEARASWYRQMGFKSEVEIEGSVGQVVADAAVMYKAECFYGDVLVIEVAADEFHPYGFDLYYRVTNKITGKEVARGKTGMVCFDYAKRKIAPVPQSLMSRLKKN